MTDDRGDGHRADEAGGEADPWLVRPGSIRLLWWLFSGVLAVTVLLQLAVATKGSFAADGWFGFGAIFGFGSCVAMVLVAKAAGLLLKRDETYYERSDADD